MPCSACAPKPRPPVNSGPTGSRRSPPRCRADQSAIDIQPANPEVVYVPAYNPQYIWGPPVDGYYPPWDYADIGFGFGYGFGPGIYIGGFFGGLGWGGLGLGTELVRSLDLSERRLFRPLRFRRPRICGRRRMGARCQPSAGSRLFESLRSIAVMAPLRRRAPDPHMRRRLATIPRPVPAPRKPAPIALAHLTPAAATALAHPTPAPAHIVEAHTTAAAVALPLRIAAALIAAIAAAASTAMAAASIATVAASTAMVAASTAAAVAPTAAAEPPTGAAHTGAAPTAAAAIANASLRGAGPWPGGGLRAAPPVEAVCQLACPGTLTSCLPCPPPCATPILGKHCG
jgi:hypothetical protein